MPEDVTVFLETEHYTVFQGQITVEKEKREGYVLLNNKTGVREMETPCLPQALMTAAQWNKAMQREFWTTYLTENEDIEDSGGRVIELMPDDIH